MRANRAARDPRSTRAAFLRDIAAIVSERSEGARGAVRESGHGFGTLKAGRGARCHAGWRGVPFWVVFGAVPSDGPETQLQAES